MGRSALPPEVVRVIEAVPVAWSRHAADAADRLWLDSADVVAAARAAVEWKREADELGEAVDGWKDSIVGRDTSGRRLYLTGKTVYYRGEKRWYVITIHEAA
ncbi:MAG: hypothetical protein HY814_04600 [Candidatus Riflebacteria bacterium]|nr:hypothetical protein [Candidatus Riflebacteria bacterium]